jgi:hypothetical protein
MIVIFDVFSSILTELPVRHRSLPAPLFNPFRWRVIIRKELVRLNQHTRAKNASQKFPDHRTRIVGLSRADFTAAGVATTMVWDFRFGKFYMVTNNTCTQSTLRSSVRNFVAQSQFRLISLLLTRAPNVFIRS